MKLQYFENAHVPDVCKSCKPNEYALCAQITQNEKILCLMCANHAKQKEPNVHKLRMMKEIMCLMCSNHATKNYVGVLSVQYLIGP